MLHPLSFVKRILVITFYFNANWAMAQVYNSSISAATGGTGRAAIESGDASFLNPATLVHLRGRRFFSSVAENELAVSLTDNGRDSVVPTGLGFVKKKSNFLSQELEEHDLALTLADFVREKFTVGLTGHYVEQRLPDRTYIQTNADLGFIYTPQPHIGIAVVAYNIMGEREDLPEELRRETQFAAGFNYIHKGFLRARVDLSSDSKYMAGFESYVNKFIISRLGYSLEAEDDRQLVSAGLGFMGPRFAVNYAYYGNTDSSADYRHSIDLEVPF